MYRRSSSSASSRKSTDTEAPTWWRISSISSSSDRSATTSRAPESPTRNARSRARRICGARNRDQAALDRAEHRGLPRRDVPDREHDTIAPVEPRAHEMRPARRVARDLVERASIDDPLAVDEGHRGLERVGRDRLDHVAREVEAGRDVPPGRVRPGLRDFLVPGLPTQQRHQGRLATVGTSATWRGWHSTPCTLLPPVDAPATRRHRSLALETARVWSRSWRPWLPT